MTDGQRLPKSAHTSRPWRIHELTADFDLEDVWQLPGRGGPGDFPLLAQAIAGLDPIQSSSGAVHWLWVARERMGQLLGWENPSAGVGARVSSVRDRFPPDLLSAPSGPEFEVLPATSLYLLEDEWAAEVANQTVHSVIHVGRVPDGPDGFRAQLAVLVKRNGLLGDAYMAAIRPFRYRWVYPATMDAVARAWAANQLEARQE